MPENHLLRFLECKANRASIFFVVENYFVQVFTKENAGVVADKFIFFYADNVGNVCVYELYSDIFGSTRHQNDQLDRRH